MLESLPRMSVFFRYELGKLELGTTVATFCGEARVYYWCSMCSAVRVDTGCEYTSDGVVKSAVYNVCFPYE
jgi:hypothetical protein